MDIDQVHRGQILAWKKQHKKKQRIQKDKKEKIKKLNVKIWNSTHGGFGGFYNLLCFIFISN
jgi:hypothetical protein